MKNIGAHRFLAFETKCIAPLIEKNIDSYLSDIIYLK